MRMLKCVNLTDQVRKLTDKVNRQASDIERYKERLKEKAEAVEKLQEKAADLERIKLYMGANKVQGIIDSLKEVERETALPLKCVMLNISQKL